MQITVLETSLGLNPSVNRFSGSVITSVLCNLPVCSKTGLRSVEKGGRPCNRRHVFRGGGSSDPMQPESLPAQCAGDYLSRIVSRSDTAGNRQRGGDAGARNIHGSVGKRHDRGYKIVPIIIPPPHGPGRGAWKSTAGEMNPEVGSSGSDMGSQSLAALGIRTKVLALNKKGFRNGA